MIYVRFIFTFIIFSLIVAWTSVSYATSWVDLTPSEVEKRADVVVLGEYIFSSKAKDTKFIFSGYEFKVTKVFKGEHLIR
jgi:cell division protein FtsW (lipid II flippase)